MPGRALLLADDGVAGADPREGAPDPLLDGLVGVGDRRQVGLGVDYQVLGLEAVQADRVGLVSAPALNKRWWAAKDVGAWTGRRLESATRCRVSEVTDLADASLSYSSLSGWEERGLLDGFLDLTRSVWRTRAYGDFWSYMLLAEGAVDIAAEPELALYDMAALDVIVREAGGRFTSLDGTDGPWGGNALATNGHLHDAALSFLGALADDDLDPDVPRRGPGSVSNLRDRQAPPVLD